MKPLTQKAANVLDTLTVNLKAVGDSVKFDNSEGTYMAACVEIVGTAQSPIEGQLVSVAHYYVQEGDMMRDPEMIFLCVDPILSAGRKRRTIRRTSGRTVSSQRSRSC